MNNKIFYWSPFIDKVATTKSVINSCYSLKKYSQNFEPVILNTCGEWNNFSHEINQKGITLENLTTLKILENAPVRKGFLKSRLLYFYILLKLYIPLLNFLRKNKDDFIIIHLITSLPLFINIFLKQNKMILRVSGLPKFTFLRKLLWSFALNKINLVFCPTIDTKVNLEKIFPKNKHKFKVLRDPVIYVKEISKLKNDNDEISYKNYFLSIGRLTKQKNYHFFLQFLKECHQKKYSNYIFLIAGEGEEEQKIRDYIIKNKMDKFVKMIGYRNNIFPLLKNAEALISTSLWEDPGFTIIESAFVNTTVISSDCPNGPKEILDYGKNGYIFKTNSFKDIEKQLDAFLNDSAMVKNKKKIKLKRYIKEFTVFNHYKNLQKNLNEYQ
jgi:glycosyltransferase involved in cell wall biosynthesis